MTNYCCKYHNWDKKQTGGLRGKDENRQTFYAQMASIPYSNTTQERAVKMKKYKMIGWIQDTDLSNVDVSVLYNPTTKEVVIGISGTRFDDKKNRFRDLRSDVGIALGVSRLGKRNSEVKKVVLATKKKYAGYDITIAGHSLGAKLAQNISKQTGIPAVTYNMGSSPIDAVGNKISKLFGRDNKESKVIHYTTNSVKNKTIDPISVSSALLKDNAETVEVKKTNNDNAHSLSQFGAGKKPNAWMLHVKKVKIANPSKQYSDILKLASLSYR
jgi:hypothetical protein